MEIKEKWSIESDSDAEWLIAQVKEELRESNRFKNSLQEQINLLQEKLNKVKLEEQEKLDRRNNHLIDYFERVDPAYKIKQKTQEKYRLPSGEIIKKIPGPAFKRDGKKLLKWLKETGKEDYIEIKEQAMWNELKAITEIVGDAVVTEDGEIVEGVELEFRPPSIEFKEG